MRFRLIDHAGVPSRRRGTAATRCRRLGRTLTLAVALAMLAAGTGCSVQPWVKPYERDHLADPIMSFDRDPVSGAYTDHVREAREGARGASSSAGGGCGCN